MRPKSIVKDGFILLHFLLVMVLVLTQVILYQEHITQLNYMSDFARIKHQKAMCLKYSFFKEHCP